MRKENVLCTSFNSTKHSLLPISFYLIAQFGGSRSEGGGPSLRSWREKGNEVDFSSNSDQAVQLSSWKLAPPRRRPLSAPVIYPSPSPSASEDFLPLLVFPLAARRKGGGERYPPPALPPPLPPPSISISKQKQERRKGRYSPSTNKMNLLLNMEKCLLALLLYFFKEKE